MIKSIPQPVVYRGTSALRISAVNGGATASGGAFIDNLPAAITASYCDGTYSIEVYSGPRMLKGVLKAAGGGETLSGTDLITNGTSWAGGPPPTGWAVVNGTLLALADSGPSGVGDTCLQVTRTGGSSQYVSWALSGATTQALYKAITYNKSGTAGDVTFRLAINNNAFSANLGQTAGTSSASWTQYSVYWSATQTNNQVILDKVNSVAGTMLWDEAQTFQVLTPSTDGSTIVSQKVGATYNWSVNQWIVADYNQLNYLLIVRKIH